jgi:hypothetical protein
MSNRPEIAHAVLVDAFASISAARLRVLPGVMACLEAVYGPRPPLHRASETDLVRHLGFSPTSMLWLGELLEAEFSITLTPGDLLGLVIESATLGRLLDLVARKAGA